MGSIEVIVGLDVGRFALIVAARYWRFGLTENIPEHLKTSNHLSSKHKTI